MYFSEYLSLLNNTFLYELLGKEHDDLSNAPQAFRCIRIPWGSPYNADSDSKGTMRTAWGSAFLRSSQAGLGTEFAGPLRKMKMFQKYQTSQGEERTFNQWVILLGAESS